MPLMSQLDEEEKRILMHKIQNKSRSRVNDDIIHSMVSKEFETELAQISEEENFNLKNRYRTQMKTIDYADKSRLAVDEAKLRDVLKNQNSFRQKFNSEIGTYEEV